MRAHLGVSDAAAAADGADPEHGAAGESAGAASPSTATPGADQPRAETGNLV